MSEASRKGPLIQKKPKSKTLERPKPIIVNNQNDFKFTNNEVKKETPTIKPPTNQTKTSKVSAEVKVPETQTSKEVKKEQVRKPKSVVGKSNNVKSIKVPLDLHVQIGVLGKFMDENKTYAIISELVDYYARNELTDRQRKQFNFMTDFFNDTSE
ncbi:hypothetical protein ACSFXN_18080 [Planococcus sp. 1R117A]|uniref:hypothetical protein n=1 Tax=Planococcus sp. 1R117A TaxID=3447020 RepID=UPI003EDC24B3